MADEKFDLLSLVYVEYGRASVAACAAASLLDVSDFAARGDDAVFELVGRALFESLGEFGGNGLTIVFVHKLVPGPRADEEIRVKPAGELEDVGRDHLEISVPVDEQKRYRRSCSQLSRPSV